MAHWKQFNNNPSQRAVGDCAVRAVSLALNVDWERAYALMANAGFQMADMPSSNAVWGSVLRMHGFARRSIPDECPDCYTIGNFADEHGKGLFVVGTGNHVATIIDGAVYDSWDSRPEMMHFYWMKEDA